MFTDLDSFELRHSRIAIVFQFFCFLILNSVFFLLVNFWIWLAFFLTMSGAWYQFSRQLSVFKFELLEHDEWSIQYRNHKQIQRITLTHSIDHYFYVVLYFKSPKRKNIVIWKDQLDQKQWKKLIIRANLN